MTVIEKQSVVEVSQLRAFHTFTRDIDRWWLRTHHAGASPLARMVLEPWPGGRWYSICEDGSELGVGKVLGWQPPGRVVLAWQLTPAFTYDASFVTELDVTFAAAGPRKTIVTLAHQHLERYGDAAAQMTEALGLGWDSLLAAMTAAATAPKFLMTYETTAESAAQIGAHLAGHIARLDEFQARGTLLMAGPVLDGSGRAVGVFTSRAAAEDFIRGDPFVVHGVAVRWSVAEWNEVMF